MGRPRRREFASATATRSVAATKVRVLFTSRAAHWLRRLLAHVTAIAHAKPSTEHAIIMRYATWHWSDLTERALNDALTGAEQSHSCPDMRRMKAKHVTDYTSIRPARRRQCGDGSALPHRAGAGDGLCRCKSHPPRRSSQTYDLRTRLAVALVHRRDRGLCGTFRASRNSCPRHSRFAVFLLLSIFTPKLLQPFGALYFYL
jgi:hypothetical protein